MRLLTLTQRDDYTGGELQLRQHQRDLDRNLDDRSYSSCLWIARFPVSSQADRGIVSPCRLKFDSEKYVLC